MRRKRTAAKAIEGKTVGVPLAPSDLDALGSYRDAEGKRTMVTPKEGPSALALFRLGVEVWKQRAGAAS